MITHNNYEAYLLDYFEGRLSTGLAEELLAFIDADKDIKQAIGELPAPGELILDIPKIVFPAKNSLKKQTLINDENYREYLIGLVENDLGLTEQKEINAYLAANPLLQAELNLFYKTKLDSADVLPFPAKAKLKKGGTVIPLYYPIAAAASLILLMGFYYFNNKPASELPVAQVITAPLSNTITAGSTVRSASSIKPLFKVNKPSEQAIISPKREHIALLKSPAIQVNKPVVKEEELVLIDIPMSNQRLFIEEEKPDTRYFSLTGIAAKELGKISARSAEFTAVVDSARSLGILNIANAGLNTIGRITGTNLKIERKTDANGNYKGITFAAASLELSHTKGK